MRIRSKLFMAFLAIILIFVGEGLYVHSAISTMSGLDREVSHNFRIYQDAVNYQSGNMQVETGTFLYLHDDQAMGRQMISEGSALMRSSRDDLRQNLDDPALQADLAELELLDPQVSAASANIMKAVDNHDSEAVLNEKLNTLSSRSEALNLRVASFVDKTNQKVSDSISQSNTYRGNTVTITYVYIVLSVVVSVLLALLLSAMITRPIKTLTTAANRISWGDMEVDIGITSKDEIGDLARSFTRMKNAIKIMTLLNGPRPEDAREATVAPETGRSDKAE